MRSISIGKFSKSALRIALLYAFSAGLWIYLSDRVLLALLAFIKIS